MEGGRSSSRLTWERSGFSPKDVDVAQMELDGELPLHTFGGSLSTGRVHGHWHTIEGARQASGRARQRQVKDVNVPFVGASAPILQGTTFIFVKEPY